MREYCGRWAARETRAITSEYFILFVCVQVVIANYNLQHNPYQKVEIMNITLHTHAHRLLNTR